MAGAPSTVAQYVRGVREDQRELVQSLLRTIRENLPEGYCEGIQYRMIGFFVPHSIYPAGYHCDPKQPLPFCGIGAQKGHVGLYFCGQYYDPEFSTWFVGEWKKTGMRLDMGKGCVRIRSLEQTPLKLIGRAVAKMSVKRFIGAYEVALGQRLAQQQQQQKKRQTQKERVAAPGRKS